MQKQTNIKFKRRLKLAGLASILLTIFMPAAGLAWGPERDTFTLESPADHVTFNSITNNNVLGDERNFVRVAEVGANGTFTDELKIEPGKEYEVYIGYHNNAASNLNASGVGMALDVRISSQFPGTVSASKKGKVSAIISSSNATPKEVWDEAYFTTDSEADVVLKYVENSATIYNGGQLNGTKLGGEYLFSEKGIYIGYNTLSGYLPGCAEYSGHIIYHLRAEQVGAKVSKSASLDGTNFFKVVNPKPGDTITYKIEFANTGTTDLTNVTFHDKLPEGVTLIEGTTILTNNANPDGVQMVDLIGQNGFNTGLYGAGATATLIYQVKVNEDIVKDGVCGTNSFTNTIFVDHDAGELQDSSELQVERTCTEGEEPGEPPVELPKTGPGEIALAIVAATCVIVGIYYWYRSQKEVMMLQKAATGKTKASHKKK
ncbi:MAG: hypothetical protein Q4D22_04460 [Candidatus Saccharibacteria bacterium]|nr:hypothetical protein [Candidatus Saccharibacteria bacterium]